MSDFDDYDFENETFVSYSFEFKSIRIVENTLFPSNIKVRAEVIERPDSEESDDSDLDLAFTKIKFFFEQVINGKSIIFCRDNEWAVERLFDDDGDNACGNSLVVTPEEPTDAHLGALIQSKLNALANGAVVFGFVEVISDNVDGLAFTFAGHGESALPAIEDWIGERFYFSKPWWARDDASTLDVIPHEEADLDQPPGFAYSLEFLREIVQPTSKMGGVVVRPEFRPKVIDGGKDDK